MKCHASGPLGMDQALLQVQYGGMQAKEEGGSEKDALNGTLSLWMQTTECYKCPLVETCTWNTNDGRGVQVLVDTKYATYLAIGKDGSTDYLCRLTEHFGEHGIYNLTIHDNNGADVQCEVQEISEPENGNLVILYVFIAYVVLWLLYYGAVFARRYCKRTRAVTPDTDLGQHEDGTPITPTPEVPKVKAPTPKKARLRSLDTFRGVSIVIMIFVNLGGGGYYFFEHSIWNGLTVADLVFPWFMFIMGTSMYLSINGALRRQASLKSVWWNIVRRSIILFLLGLFINGNPQGNDWRTLRIFGVLQRFGVTYFIVGIFLCIRFLRTRRGSGSDVVTDLSIFGDVKALWVEWILVAALVTIHTCITFLLPVPGCPKGYLGPGGLADGGSYENCTGGADGYVDQTVLSVYHMYAYPTCRVIYQTKVPYDPEGILGTLTATLTVFLGVQSGATLVSFSSHRGRLVRWLSWGLATGIAAGILCTFSKNDGWIPVNKNLWSLSYVFTMGAMSYVVLSSLYFIIDVNHWWDGAPFYHAGMNSIVLYMAHECFGEYLPFSWQPLVSPTTHAEQLVMNAWATTLFVVLAIYLHYKKIFISV